jgi:V/A-type H+-transporting ATPase subunit K
MSIADLLAVLLTGNGLAAIGAMIAIGVSGLVVAYALQISGQSAIGATLEKEKLFGRFLTLQLMPQTQLVYGLIAAILIANAIRGGGLTVEQGWICVCAGLAVALTSVSAIFQGMLSASSIGSVSRNEKLLGKMVVYIVTTEIAALFGLVVAFMLLNFGGIL